MDTWSSNDVDVLDHYKESIIDKIVEQIPLEKVSETLQNAFGNEVPADLETNKEEKIRK